jgi:MSHA biogenesis protein MshQ
LAWSEVGDLVLSAATANGAGYLGSGQMPWGSGAAGPFKPAYLTTELETAQPCGSFTYSGQPFRVRVKAMSAANAVLGTSAAVTENYFGSYAKAVDLGSDGALSCAPPTTGFSNYSLVAADFTSTPGEATTAPATNTVAPLPVSYARSPIGAPAVVNVCAKDTDGVNSHGQAQAALTVRNGRLRLANAYGSELLPLRVPVVAEYYEYYAPNLRWIANPNDSCTTVPAAAVALSGGISVNTSASAVTIINGVGTLTLAKPSPVNRGHVDVALNLGASGTAQDDSCNSSSPPPTTAANLPWLQFDQWCTVAADPKRDPNARVKFGSPKAPYIYLRERY